MKPSSKLIFALAGLLPLLPCVPAHGRQGRMVPLDAVTTRFGWSEPSLHGYLVQTAWNHRYLCFELDARGLVVDGVKVFLNAPVVRRAETLLLRYEDAEDVVAPLLDPRVALFGKGWQTIALDPGHGGEDSGAIGHRDVVEKLLTLDVARRARKKLMVCQVPVVLTRDDDVTMSIDERCAAAQRADADVLVSIHANAGSDQAAGVESHVMAAAGYPNTHETSGDTRAYPGNQFDGANSLLGFFVQKGLMATTGAADRGIKHSRFQILRGAACPTALVECGFVTNRREAARMLDPDYRDAIAEGIARGILTYASWAAHANDALDLARRRNAYSAAAAAR